MNIKYPLSALFLDSGGGWTSGKENSFILFRNPAFSLSFNGRIATIDMPGKRLDSSRDPLSILEGYLSEGYFAAGYLGYEFSRFTQEGFLPIREKGGELLVSGVAIKRDGSDEQELSVDINQESRSKCQSVALTHRNCGSWGTTPVMYFLFFSEEDMILGDIENLRHLIQIPHQEYSHPEKLGDPCSNMSKGEYIDMVKRAKRYIENGDVYQVNLSQRFTVPLKSSPLAYFLDLYDVQPVPFGCYMDFGGFQLISGSMELFLRKTERKLFTKPIKGTRKKGFTDEADAILRAELVSSEKERAENLMIVDLMRNDLGRVCKYGTVRVNKLFDIESYSTLHQMVSEVEGHLRDGVKTSDIIKSAFPSGSVTGAPKKRALEIIDELEPHLRGPYCGALGILSPDGDFTLSVAIRVLVSREGSGSVMSGAEGTFWVGGGIVWDSDPEKEYEETLVKARAIKKALGMAE